MQKIRQDAQLGQYIRNLRLSRGLTQDDVARELQLMGCTTTRSIYSQIENGTYNIRVNELLALKKIFKANSLDEFFPPLEEVLQENQKDSVQ